MFVGTQCTVVDGTGVKVSRVVHIYQRGCKKISKLGSIVLVSIVRRDFTRRRIRLGQVFRALVVGRGSWSRRQIGPSVCSLNLVILLKKSDVVPISKRVRSPVPVDLRRKKLVKILAMGFYVY